MKSFGGSPRAINSHRLGDKRTGYVSGLHCWATAVLVLTLASCGGDSSSRDDISDTGGAGEEPSGPVLPPDPGEAGLATIEGIDADGDGVRDDLQRFIVLTYPDSEVTQNALLQTAVALQAQLHGSGSKERALRSAQQTMRAVECVYSVNDGGSDQDKTDALAELQSRVLNTEDRLLAYAAFDELMWGEVVTALPINQHATACAE